MTRLAIALGGNALIRRGEAGSTEVQRRNLVAAARGLVTLAEGSRAEIVLTHGNGPQVGLPGDRGGDGRLRGSRAAAGRPGRRNAGPDRLPAGQRAERCVPGAGPPARDSGDRDPDGRAGRRPRLHSPDQAGRPHLRRGDGQGARPNARLDRRPGRQELAAGGCLAAAAAYRGGGRPSASLVEAGVAGGGQRGWGSAGGRAARRTAAGRRGGYRQGPGGRRPGPLRRRRRAAAAERRGCGLPPLGHATPGADPAAVGRRGQRGPGVRRLAGRLDGAQGSRLRGVRARRRAGSRPSGRWRTRCRSSRARPARGSAPTPPAGRGAPRSTHGATTRRAPLEQRIGGPRLDR